MVRTRKAPAVTRASTTPSDDEDGAAATALNGITPKALLADGETRTFKSRTSATPYTQKRSMDHYYCNCAAWRIADGAVDARTCRHLLALLGGAYEEARLEAADLNAAAGGKKSIFAVALVPPKKLAGRNRKSPTLEDEEEEEEEIEEDEYKDADEEEGEEEEEEEPVKSRKRRAASFIDDDVEDEEDEEEAPPPPKKRSRAATAAPKLLKDKNFKPLLAHKWDLDNGADPKGWLMSEKLDGVRAIWHGDKGTFLSREGNPFYAPAWFTKRFPKDQTLDGEFFTKRGGFQDCVSIVRTQDKPERWKFSVSYQIFDVPSLGDQPFEKRLEWLQKRFSGRDRIRWVNVLENEVCEGRDQLFERLDEVCEKKGEGLMLREPGSKYVEGRSRTLLKVKRFFDADAVVRGHERGSGKNSNVTGALNVEMLDDQGKPTGKIFKIGSGLSDAQRKKPPKIGSVVIYRYQELSKSGSPRFPTFVGERAD